MAQKPTVQGTEKPPIKYARAAAAARYFQIGRSTLWQWVTSRRAEGFPQPFKAGPRVTLFDVEKIEAFLAGGAA